MIVLGIWFGLFLASVLIMANATTWFGIVGFVIFSLCFVVPSFIGFGDGILNGIFSVMIALSIPCFVLWGCIGQVAWLPSNNTLRAVSAFFAIPLLLGGGGGKYIIIKIIG